MLYISTSSAPISSLITETYLHVFQQITFSEEEGSEETMQTLMIKWSNGSEDEGLKILTCSGPNGELTALCVAKCGHPNVLWQNTMKGNTSSWLKVKADPLWRYKKMMSAGERMIGRRNNLLKIQLQKTKNQFSKVTLSPIHFFATIRTSHVPISL